MGLARQHCKLPVHQASQARRTVNNMGYGALAVCLSLFLVFLSFFLLIFFFFLFLPLFLLSFSFFFFLFLALLLLYYFFIIRVVLGLDFGLDFGLDYGLGYVGNETQQPHKATLRICI